MFRYFGSAEDSSNGWGKLFFSPPVFEHIFDNVSDLFYPSSEPHPELDRLLCGQHLGVTLSLARISHSGYSWLAPQVLTPVCQYKLSAPDWLLKKMPASDWTPELHKCYWRENDRPLSEPGTRARPNPDLAWMPGLSQPRREPGLGAY